MSKRTRRLRYVLVVVGLLGLVGILGGVKFAQIASLIGMGKQMEKAGPPPEAVGTQVAEARQWESTLAAVGSVAGVESVVVSNEVPGLVTRIGFQSGELVERGKILVELDSQAERAQLVAAKARRDYAESIAKQSRTLAAQGAIPGTQLENDETQLTATTSDVRALEAQLERKVVRAPFAGRIGIRGVDLGQYLNPGTRVTVLDSVGDVYVDFSLPQGDVASVHSGLPVSIASRGVELAGGTITAVDPTIDSTSRNLRIRASVPNREAKLRPGMFVDVAVVLPDRQSVVTVPATAIVHAPYGDSVFVIEDKPPGSPGISALPDGRPVMIARQRFVRLGPARGDFVPITEGVTAGRQVVSAGAFKLRNGSPVVIDNRVEAKPQLDPRPENR